MTDTPIWQPTHPKQTHMWKFMRFVEAKYFQKFTNYHELHAWSIQYSALFWQALVDYFNIQLDTNAHTILSNETDMLNAKWFQGATLNFAQQLLSRNDEHPAIISIDETQRREVLSYKQLRQQVSMCARGLQEAGVQVGDRVAGILPNTSTAIIAMLAATSLGAIWSSCSPDFGSDALLDRLSQIAPKVLFTTNGQQYHGQSFDTLEKIATICPHLPSLQLVVVYPYLEEANDLPLSNAIYWCDFLKPCDQLTFVSLPFDHPIYILFSSGTTGKPKCIMHGAGGTLLQHIKELGLHTDLKSSDNLCFYTTCGWMMWNWMASALYFGTTLTLYEGAPTYPDAGVLFQIIEKEQVSIFGTSAKFISSIEKAGYSPSSEFTFASLRTILSTGSPLLPQQYDFVAQCIKKEVQVCSISGGTDIVSCFALGNPILPVYRGELQCLGLGLDVNVFDEHGTSITKTRGELVCIRPFPCMPVGFWNDPQKVLYKKTYFERFPGIWTHGDFAEITEHGGLIIYGRSDATLNPGGVRIGTAEIYRQIEQIPEVVDSIVIGQPWQDDVRVVLFVKLRESLQLDQALQNKIKHTIRTHASPRHVPQKIVQVGDIPRTLSGKIVEIAVRQTVAGETVNNLNSIANPNALNDFKNRDELRD